MEVLAHAAKRILHPTFLWSQTSDLLELLAHIERLRVHTVAQAEFGLECVVFKLTEHSSPMTRPSDDETEQLRSLADKEVAKVRRTEYRHLVMQIRWMVRTG